MCLIKAILIPLFPSNEPFFSLVSTHGFAPTQVVVKRSRRRSLVNSILSLSRKTSNTIKRL